MLSVNQISKPMAGELIRDLPTLPAALVCTWLWPRVDLNPLSSGVQSSVFLHPDFSPPTQLSVNELPEEVFFPEITMTIVHEIAACHSSLSYGSVIYQYQ